MGSHGYWNHRCGFVRKSAQLPRKLKTLYCFRLLEADLTLVVAGLRAAIGREQEAGHAALTRAQLKASATRLVATFAGGAVAINPTQRADTHVTAEITATGRAIASLVETRAVRVEGACAAAQGTVVRGNDKALASCGASRGVDTRGRAACATQGFIVCAGRE